MFLLKKIVSYQVVKFSKSEASGRSSDLDAETDDAGGPAPFTPHSSVILLFFLVSFQRPLNCGHSSPLFSSVSFVGRMHPSKHQYIYASFILHVPPVSLFAASSLCDRARSYRHIFANTSVLLLGCVQGNMIMNCRFACSSVFCISLSASVSVCPSACLSTRVSVFSSSVRLYLYVCFFDHYMLSGGTGATFDHEVAKLVGEAGVPVIVAGGLTADNVEICIVCTSSFGVDVSSGVEQSKGVKNLGEVKKFMREARLAQKDLAAKVSREKEVAEVPRQP